VDLSVKGVSLLSAADARRKVLEELRKRVVRILVQAWLEEHK
jgi:hypothetical protein